jgi:hypothetical protein
MIRLFIDSIGALAIKSFDTLLLTCCKVIVYIVIGYGVALWFQH